MKRLSQEKAGGDASRATERLRQGALNHLKELAFIGGAALGLSGCAGAMSAGSGDLMAKIPSSASMSDYSAPQNGPSVSSTPSVTLLAAASNIAPDATSVEIMGKKLNVVRLDARLADLDRQTEQYREGEFLPKSADDYYTNSVRVPGKIRFVVSINHADGNYRVDMDFPNRSSGTGGVNLNDFATYVEKVSGQKMERVKFVVEIGTFDDNGSKIEFESAHLFPLNAKGEPITKRGNGEFIVYTASHFADRGGGSASLLIEPENRDTLYASR
jgi:hypothetical protein